MKKIKESKTKRESCVILFEIAKKSKKCILLKVSHLREPVYFLVLSNMEMRAATETAISATLDHDKNVLELLQTGEEKEQLEDDYKSSLCV